MDNRNKTTVRVNGKGVGFGGLLTLVFIVLKLMGIINWSWVWVLSPIWISILITIFSVIIFCVIMEKIYKGNKK